jgi:transposase-like protein
MANDTTYPRVGDHTPSARAQREEHWRRVLARLKQSGLARAAFCRREGINENALTWWMRQLRRRDQARRPGKEKMTRQRRARHPAFVPVRVIQTTPRSGTSALEVVTRSGHVVRLQADFDPATLRRVLGALEGQPW